MLLDREHFLGGEGARPFLVQRAESAVALVAPGAAGDLRHFGDRQPAGAAPVELAQGREGDMRHVHVEAHADRIGRDQIIDLAGLEHRDLGVARARRQRAHHHRRATAQPPQHLGDGIDFLGRESDDHRAFGQARQFARAGIAQRRKARAADDLGLGQQRLHHRPQAFGAEQHGFFPPARTQEAVGEDMAAFGIGAQLRLVERDEGELAVERHRFRRTQKPARAGRADPLLAGDQRDLARSLDLDHAIIDFAREQAQRKADHPARMAGQAFDREMGLAGVGRPQNGGHRRGSAHDAPNVAPPPREGNGESGEKFGAAGHAARTRRRPGVGRGLGER